MGGYAESAAIHMAFHDRSQCNHPSRPAPADPALLRALPQVQKLMESEAAGSLRLGFRARPWSMRFGTRWKPCGARYWRERRALTGCVADLLAEILLDSARAALEPTRHRHLRRVINGTGIIIHTNLGRAPLAEPAVAAVAAVASGYSNLEFDLENGERGSRDDAVTGLLRELTGAEAAMVVNNNAAAVLLAVSAWRGREVLVSRRNWSRSAAPSACPDVIRQGGARLGEVGTTNRTRVSDYEAAITPETRAIVKVHQSNYRIVGFTSAPAMADLAALARARGLVLMEDLGSGTLLDLRRSACPMSRPSARASRPAPIWSCSAATSCWADRRRGSSWAGPT